MDELIPTRLLTTAMFVVVSAVALAIEALALVPGEIASLLHEFYGLVDELLLLLLGGLSQRQRDLIVELELWIGKYNYGLADKGKVIIPILILTLPSSTLAMYFSAASASVSRTEPLVSPLANSM